MHYTPLPEKHEEYPMAAVFEDTAPQTDSPWVLPGRYTVRLTVGGQSYTQPLRVTMDPRVRTSLASLSQQFTLSKQIYDDLSAGAKTVEEMEAARKRLEEAASSPVAAELAKKVEALHGDQETRAARRGAPRPDTFASVTGTLTALLQGLQEADVAPTPQTVAAVAERRAALTKLMHRWTELKADLSKGAKL
jgi:hypothetical protein